MASVASLAEARPTVPRMALMEDVERGRRRTSSAPATPPSTACAAKLGIPLLPAVRTSGAPAAAPSTTNVSPTAVCGGQPCRSLVRQHLELAAVLQWCGQFTSVPGPLWW